MRENAPRCSSSSLGIPEALAAAFDSDPAKLKAQFHRVEHHQAHLASAFFVSPFEQAALLSADGLGDFASTMWGTGAGARMKIDGAVAFPHSLGLYYSAVTQYLGFPKFGDEYKVMGLAAYGEPESLDVFRDIVRFDPNSRANGFELGLDYFVHHRTGPEMSWADAGKTPTRGKAVLRRDGPAARTGTRAGRSAGATAQESLGVAASPPRRGVSRHVDEARAQTGLKSVCLAGGCAFNCVANGKILDATPFREVFVQPAAGDAGLAIGAAYYVWHQKLGKPRSFAMGNSYWGPEFSRDEIRKAIDASAIANNGFCVIGVRTKKTSASAQPQSSRTEKFSAGFRDAPNGVRARWAIAASSPIRGGPT